MLVLLAVAALALPPSSTLTSAKGVVTWEVTERSGQLRVHGALLHSDLRHTSDGEFSPVRTVRTLENGDILAIEYSAIGAEVRFPDGTVRSVAATGLWDAGSLPIRLGVEHAAGRDPQELQVVDDKGRLRTVTVDRVGEESCGEMACVHLEVRGKPVAADYWFDAQGTLLRSRSSEGDFTSY